MFDMLGQSQPLSACVRGLAWVSVGACVALAAAACKSDYPSSAAGQGKGGDAAGGARQVKVAKVSEMPVGASVQVTGTLAAQDQATVSVKVPGRLRALSVDLGSVVRKGQLITQVEPQDYQLRVQQAEAALSQARARLGLSPDGGDEKVNFEQTGTVRQARAQMDEARKNRERAVTLVEQGVVARTEFETADAAYKVAVGRYQDAVEEVRNRQGLLAQRRTELALARQQLADTNILAPFDGIVQERKASVGEYLAAGAPVVEIVRVNPLRFRAEVPERDAANVRAGQQVRVTVEGSAKTYAGRIVRLSPTITEQSRVLVVEAEVGNDGSLRPGSFARADITTSDTSMAVTIPSNALVNFAGIEKVILVQNGKALEKSITTGRRINEWTEVLAGVSVGDTVVVSPGNLQSGMAVQVVE
ncbi:MAG TPA: efflux RND transporter periplasmic adaptor subunit [Pyrinomonadaceae bacterium]|jgi:RND family efflux transporter MFP subunit|nr:efflux RND transporter periplasmic adaptor subunit [Pyrinomonadaceae bacterium]